ncbi:MAG TPA: carboxypeptidase-like regulatory domain-containing protein [Acidobacteriaceae bacterium]|nr:carboxypeptidase-like regulatory domain-containing protein [Acidobacteriaceae bacterium]
MFKRMIKPLAFGFLLALTLTQGMTAQTAGGVSGHVADPTGAVLPGVEVTLTETATAAVRKTVTTQAGDYTFTEVPPGFYTLKLEHAGFKKTQSESFEVQVQQSVRQNFTLQVGDVTQSIEVSTTGALLQADNASLGTVVENAELKELPLNGRNYLGLVALASNVNTLSSGSGQAGSRLGGDRASQSIAVGGQRIMFDYYTLDGVNNTDPDFNTYISQPSIDGIQEFKVQTGVYSAEFGHEASQINVVTKSGTNTFHGGAYEFIRNNYVDALPYWFPQRHPAGTPQIITPFKYNDFGFELDGPIWIPKVINGRDKLFFMVDDEWYRSRSSNPNATAVVPTAAMAGGNFQGFNYQYETPAGQVVTVPVTIYDRATNTPFLNNQIPTNKIAAQSTALLQYLGTAATLPTYNCPTTAPKVNTNCSAVPNYKYTTVNPVNRQHLAVRGDYNMSSKSQFSFRYSRGNENSVSTGLLGAGSKLITQYQQYMGSFTRTFSPSVVNEARFGYSRFFNSQGLLAAYTNDVVDGLHIPGLAGGDPSTWGIPEMGFSNASKGTVGVGTGSTPSIWSTIGDAGGDGPYVITDPTWQIVDNVTWVKGRHSVRLGFEYNRQTFNQLGNQFSRGQFNSRPFTTSLFTGSDLSGGDSLADFLLGNLFQSTVAVAVADANYVRNVEAAYVDDTYKVTPKFTISLGLRYELTPPWNDTFGNNFNTLLPVIPKVGDTSATYGAASTPATYNPDGTVKTPGTYNPNYPYYVRQGNCDPSNVYSGIAIRWTATKAVCSNGVVPNGPLMNTSYTNFAPRLGISYSPNAKLVIRTGYGIFYTQDIGNAYFDMARNIAGRVTVNNLDGNTLGIPSSLTWANATPGATGTSTVNLPATTVAFANATTHHTSYTEQFLLNVQQQVGKNWSFEAGYQGAVSRHLYGFFNGNQPTPFGLLGPGLGYSITSNAASCPTCTKASITSTASREPFQNVQSGLQVVHDEGTGNYNSGSVKVNRRFSKGLDLIASYTYSKSLDDTSGVRNQGNDLLNAQNGLCIPCEYGPSAFDVRNRVVAGGLYELPIGPDKLIPLNNKIVNALIGGWQIGGTFTHQTGQVGTPQYGGDNSGLGGLFGNFDRPNVTGISPFLPCNSKTVDSCANKAAYSQPGVIVTLTTKDSAGNVTTGPNNIGGLWGNATRGSFHGPGFTNLDASLHKSFVMPYSEKHHLDIRFEAFNALNHPNWTTPNLTYTSSNFGQVNAGGMRQLQLAAKYQF